MVKVLDSISYNLPFMVGSMSNIRKIEESLLFSGVDKLDLILDIDLLMKESNLTNKQLLIVRMYFFEQYTQEEISEYLGISQQAVLDHLNRIKIKMKKVLEGWKDKDEKQFNNR